MSDFGIKISAKDNDVNTAAVGDLLLNSKYPFSKIDTQHTNSFTTVNLSFNNDPPNVIGGESTTLVYSLPHGYSYIPQYWVTANWVTTPTALDPMFDYYQDYISDIWPGYIFRIGLADYAYIFFRADATNIKVYVYKFTNAIPVDLRGGTIQLGFYVFVDGI